MTCQPCLVIESVSLLSPRPLFPPPPPSLRSAAATIASDASVVIIVIVVAVVVAAPLSSPLALFDADDCAFLSSLSFFPFLLFFPRLSFPYHGPRRSRASQLFVLFSRAPRSSVVRPRSACSPAAPSRSDGQPVLFLKWLTVNFASWRACTRSHRPSITYSRLVMPLPLTIAPATLTSTKCEREERSTSAAFVPRSLLRRYAAVVQFRATFWPCLYH